jgi:hypothetical protein
MPPCLPKAAVRHNEFMDDQVVVCSLSPSARQARRENLLKELLGRAQERHELPNGYRLSFLPRADVLASIASMIEAERQCCRFLRFTLTVEPDAGPIVLDVTGPAGTREFLAAMADET